MGSLSLRPDLQLHTCEAIAMERTWQAAAAGLPIVALPACEGLVELLRGQPGVWLAPEISAETLAASLLAALHALRPGERFAHAFVEAFRLDRAIQAYERLIDQSLRLEPPTEC